MIKKNKPPLAFFALFIAACSFSYNSKGQIRDNWNGVVQFTQKMTGDFIKINEKKIDITIANNVVTDSVVYKADHSMTTAAGTVISKKNCDGKGTGELHAVDISGGEYYVHIITHTYNCTSVTTEEGTVNFTEQSDITFSGTFFNSNQDVLSGSDTTTVDTGAGEGQTIITWYLTRKPLDVELIVSPDNYDIWLPRPGADELKKGNVMDIQLKVQKRNGQPASLRVDFFELRLDSTSREPGITVNMPLARSSHQLPDIRFLPASIGESISDDQKISFPSPDGITGTATIASYDGGGWTTLTAVAILENGFRIEGSLFTPRGVKRIPIPKRDPGTHIAKSWLVANGNPSETDDKEPLPAKPGDGLTAYEEYRGVISQRQFIRLKPTEKDLGVMLKRSEAMEFEEGIKWLEAAAGLKVIRFDETEIGADRRINKNFLTAHDYDQYVLRLENIALARDVVGENRPESIQLKVPRQSDLVAINLSSIKRKYQAQAASAAAAGIRMPYTEAEEIANTVAHEIGHGIHIIHHGKSSAVPPRKAYANSNPPFKILWFDNTEETARPYPVPANDFLENAGTDGNDASGDLSCIMAYTSLYDWAFRTSNTDGTLYYYKTPLLPVGKRFCTSQKGTGINDPMNRGVNNINKYFGNAENGNCRSRIQLRD